MRPDPVEEGRLSDVLHHDAGDRRLRHRRGCGRCSHPRDTARLAELVEPLPVARMRHSSVRSDRTALRQEAIPPDEPLKLAGWLLPPAGAWLSTGLEPATRVARRWLSAILALLSFLQVGPPLDRRLLALMLLDKLSFERPPGCVDVRHVSDEILDVADSPSRCSGRTVESRRA